MEVYSATAMGAVTATGTLTYLASATITVYDSDGNIATIYSDDGETLQANPFQSGDDGDYSFYAANGVYSITVAKTGYDTDTRPDVTLHDPQDPWPDADLPISEEDKVGLLQGEELRHASVATLRDSIASTALDAVDDALGYAQDAAASAADAALTTQSGTYAAMLALATPSNGDVYLVTSGAGSFSSWWFYDGVRAAWYPVGGTLRLARAVGAAKSSPLGSYTGGATGKLLATSISIPADLLRQGCEVRVYSHLDRSGANGTATLQVRLGTNNTANDNTMGSIAFTATDAQQARPLLMGEVQSSTGWLGGTSNNFGNVWTASNEYTTYFNIASAMYLNWYISGANSSDTHRLHAYDVEIRYGL